MLRQVKKQENTQSKSNLVELFRKRIETRSNKNTPVHPSMKPVVPSSVNPRQRVTPSKTSIFSLQQPSQISLRAEGYLNDSKQQLICTIHNNKQAKFVRNDTDQYYCQKCAIVLTNEGCRLVQIDGTTRIKKMLQKIMQKQISMIQETYQKVIGTIHLEMQQQIRKVKQYFNTVEVEETMNKVKVQMFVPNEQLQKILQKLKTSIGKVSLKSFNTEIVRNKCDISEIRQSHRRSQKSYGRQSQKSEKSARRKNQPTQVMINLYLNESNYSQKGKQNRQVNILF